MRNEHSFNQFYDTVAKKSTECEVIQDPINHWVIILNTSNNSVFLYLKIYWNRQVFDLIRASGIRMKPETLLSPGFFLKILNFVFESINMGLDHKLFLQLFVIGFCLFCSRIGKR